jgi:hypothetical protein
MGYFNVAYKNKLLDESYIYIFFFSIYGLCLFLLLLTDLQYIKMMVFLGVTLCI